MNFPTIDSGNAPLQPQSLSLQYGSPLQDLQSFNPAAHPHSAFNQLRADLRHIKGPHSPVGPDAPKFYFPKQSMRCNTFGFFSILPGELRMKIWQMALPRGFSRNVKLVFCVEIICGTPREGELFDCKFRLTPSVKRLDPCLALRSRFLTEENLEGDEEEVAIDEVCSKDLRLLETCCESRNVYLETFPHTLLANRGVIRFNNQSVFYIANFVTVSDIILRMKKLEDARLPNFEDVKSVAITGPIWKAIGGLALFGGLKTIEISTVSYAGWDRICDLCTDLEYRGEQEYGDDIRIVDSFKNTFAENWIAEAWGKPPGSQLPEVKFHC